MSKKADRNKPFNLKEVYPNSPLVEVVCELRFHGELEIECRRDEFQKKVKKNYPKLFVPNVKHGSPAALTPYRFETVDESQGIMISLSSFAFYSRKYQGYSMFSKELFRLVELFGKTYPVDELTRLGWRYINIIPFAREEGMVPLERLFKLGFKLPEALPDRHKNLSLKLQSQVGRGVIITKLESTTRRSDAQEVFLLDLDYSITEDLRLKDVKKYINEARLCSRSTFEGFITEDYRNYLKGGELVL